MQYPEFDDIIANLDKGKLASFPGGVHPQGRKAMSNQTVIARVPLPTELIIPVRQHIGTDGTLLVNTGDKVQKGQPLTHSGQPFSVPVHAPTSGEVIAIAEHVTAHPSGLSELCITLKPDGNDTWINRHPITDYQAMPKQELVGALCDAGISGMGGAGFPTHIKASSSKAVEFLVINGAECEPYITSDDRLMREHAGNIIEGIDILSHLLNPKCIVIAIEDNKPEAIAEFSRISQVRADIRVVAVETKYPAGGEKQLIQVVTGREVPRKGLPIDVGVTMFNVGTCYAVADAILRGTPLIERVVTMTGEAVARPGNYWALLGTPVNHLLSHVGYLADKQASPQVIMGGPMMGFTLNDAAVPVVKTTNCLLVPATNELVNGDNERACIRCSACADACPATLLPQQLFWHSKAKEYDKAQEYNLFDCIECGACAYVCPSEIPLVHYYRKAKADIRLERDEKNKADKAKERFEARKARLEREKLEREEKHRKAKEARLAASNTAPSESKSAGGAKDKVAAALARAKAKKAEAMAADEASTTAESGAEPTDKKAAVAAAIARAKAKKAAQVNTGNEAAEDTGTTEASTAQATDEPPQEDKRKAAVAAAIARAKAKKAAQAISAVDSDLDKNETADPTPADEATAPSQPAVEPEDKKKAAVAAAIARAKAKKAAQAAKDAVVEEEAATPSLPSESQDKPTANAESADSDDSEKKKRVAAAVAKAKAKKAQQAKQQAAASEQKSQSVSAEQSPEDDAAAEKKRRIAVAVAKAKARKAAQEDEK